RCTHSRTLYDAHATSVCTTHTDAPAIHPLSLHDALPISHRYTPRNTWKVDDRRSAARPSAYRAGAQDPAESGSASNQRHPQDLRSEEHTSELQSRENLVCRLLLEKKNNKRIRSTVQLVSV